MDVSGSEALGVRGRRAEERGEDETILRGVERRLGVDLPADDRSVVARFGGFSFEGSVAHLDPRSCRHVEFGWRFDAPERAETLDDHAGSLPDGVFAIGDDGSGNLDAPGVVGPDLGRGCFHDHGYGWSDEAAGIRARGEPLPASLRHGTIDPMAETFAEFVGTLRALD